MSATPIPLGGGGVINVSNLVGNVVAISGNTLCIAFSGPANAPTPCNAVSGILVSGVDPIFGTSGTIHDVAATSVVAFKTANLTIAGGPAIWDLVNFITPTGFPVCTTSTTSGSCVAGDFLLTQSSPTQISVSLSLNEIGYLGSKATGSTPYLGILTTQLSGDLTQFGCTGPNCADTIGNLVLWESGAGHKVTTTWSMTESPVVSTTPPVPEPGSVLLICSGLAAVVFFGKGARRRAAAAQ